MRKINGLTVDQKKFAYEGCHKIYLISNKKQEEEAKSYDYKILPIEALKETFENSCGLRFIHTWTLKKTFVKQGEKANFEGWL